MSTKTHKSKTPQDPNVTFEAELIESKIRAIGDYAGGVLTTCGIKQGRGFASDLLLLENSTAFHQNDPIPTLEMAECHKILLGLPFGLRSVDFLLNEVNLRTVNLLGSDQFTCDYKVPKYSLWEKLSCTSSYYGIAEKYGTNLDRASNPNSNWDLSPINPYDINMITRSREFSNYYSSSSSSSDNYAQANEASVSTKEPKRIKTTANQLTIEPAKSPKKAAPTVASASEQPLGFVHQVKFSGSRLEIVFLEPSCPLSIEAGTEGSQLCSLHATNSWRRYQNFESSDWELLNKGTFESLLQRSYNLKQGLQRVEMLETELCLTGKHHDVMDKKWNDSESELPQVKEEDEKQQRAD
uniref:Uncharacterized protein n=1 Tax=Cannabis sativa TaxID=3483 RepID=A0A803PSV4_CANSA